jgi:hypothetical protein
MNKDIAGRAACDVLLQIIATEPDAVTRALLRARGTARNVM